MTQHELSDIIQKKESFLCIGLDTDINLIPTHLRTLSDPVFEFNKAIIDATYDIAVAYKPNLAFYESMGMKGWESLEKTMEYLAGFRSEIFTIADAKRGDIGNTSKMYAKTFFDWLKFDSVTVAPYMGEDSVTPFLEYKDKWVILLGLTSNKGSRDFQFLETSQGKLYEQVIRKAQEWASPEQLMFVVGATHPGELKHIRSLAPENFFLVPGVGAQGGNIDDIAGNGMNSQCGLLINSSRNIIYASNGNDFAQSARAAALELKNKMSNHLKSLRA